MGDDSRRSAAPDERPTWDDQAIHDEQAPRLRHPVAPVKRRLDRALSKRPDLYAAVLGFRPRHDANKRLFLRLVRPGDVVFEVGPNRGYYTCLFSRLVGRTGRVHAFEPVPESYAILQEALTGEPTGANVDAQLCAVADHEGSATVFVPGVDDGQASLRRHSAGSWAGASSVRELTCSTITLDAYASRRGIERNDLLKCDVEGAELLVLRGAEAVLARCQPALHLEMSGHWPRAFGYQREDLLRWLGDFGYVDLRLVRREGLTPLHLDSGFAAADESENVLCLPPGERGERLRRRIGIPASDAGGAVR
jgi:FkbM family methyltransferase